MKYMSTKSLVLGIGAGILLVAAAYFMKASLPGHDYGVGGERGTVACTADAMLCPDGSYVGRTGPNCEFVCPNLPSNATLEGRVTLSPVCPVERTPPDPNCAPKPYRTVVEVRKTGQVSLLAATETDARGAFQFRLSPGSYDVIAIGKNPFPRCEGKTVVLGVTATSPIDLGCDTGIR